MTQKRDARGVKAALDKLVKNWRLERQATVAAHQERLATWTLAERVEHGEALAELEIFETSPAPGGRVLLWCKVDPVLLRHLRLSPGEPIRLWVPEDPSEGVSAVLGKRRRDRIAILLGDDFPEWVFEIAFNLDAEPSDVTFKRGLAAIERLTEAPAESLLGDLRRVFYADEPVSARQSVPESYFDQDLNDKQKEALSLALGARPLALVHGPPGTGKTRTLVEVIRQSIRNGDRVLATAASNYAVDNIAERLAATGLEVVRVGHPARMSAAVESLSLDAKLEGTDGYKLSAKWIQEANTLFRKAKNKRERRQIGRDEYRDMIREARGLLKDARRQLRGAQSRIISRADVVCSTATGADSQVLYKEHFDLVVFDEATQCPDPIALVALSRGERVVMAGDQHQLPPTVISREAERQGLGTTYFERLAKGQPEAAVMLEVQHRMHADLMRFPSESKYEGRLVAAAHVAERTLVSCGYKEDYIRTCPLTFIDTAGTGWEEEKALDLSTRNIEQAARVVKEARRVLSRGLDPGDVAVITPYHAQVRHLREALALELDDGLEVSTVDAFQGREKEVIVLDLVRSNGRCDIGFLKDTRRMNVALTRAKCQLIVVGDSATIAHHPYYAAFLKTVESLDNAWLSAYVDDAETLW